MKLPEAVKAKGRFSVVFARTGEEHSSVCCVADAKLRPSRPLRAESDLSGGERLYVPGGGALCELSASELESAPEIRNWAYGALAQGRPDLLRGVRALVIIRDVYEPVNGQREYMAVKYEGCALVPKCGGRWELKLKAPGTLGVLCGENYVDFDECFEEGWPYDD